MKKVSFIFIFFPLFLYSCKGFEKTIADIQGTYLLKSYIDTLNEEKSPKAFFIDETIPTWENNGGYAMTIFQDIIFLWQPAASAVFKIKHIEKNTLMITDFWENKKTSAKIKNGKIIIDNNNIFIKISDETADLRLSIPGGSKIIETFIKYSNRVIFKNRCYKNNRGDSIFCNDNGLIVYQNVEYFMRWGDTGNGYLYDALIENTIYGKIVHFFKVEKNVCYIYRLISEDGYFPYTELRETAYQKIDTLYLSR